MLFLTSNLATDVITQLCVNGTRPPLDTVMSAIRPILSNHFKPALLARMSIVPFYTLDTKYMKDIVSLSSTGWRPGWRRTTRSGSSTRRVVERITARCTEVETGPGTSTISCGGRSSR